MAVVEAESPPPVPKTAAATARPGPAANVRRVVHTSALCLCIFLFVRAAVLEPFGVPTGSMAPTLIGNHREAPCPRCGYPVRIGNPGKGQPDPFAEACCQNCGKTHINMASAREVPGDRLLVDKNVFSARSPRRWEVAVFRCPVDPTVPYVKRIGGLPSEAVQVIGGDLFANGLLQRKTLTQARETAVVFFDMNFSPPAGWAVRWLAEPLAENPNLPSHPGAARPRPADDAIVRDHAVVLDATTPECPAVGLTYRHWDLDAGAERPVTDWLAYNGWPAGDRRHPSSVPVHDFLLACELEVLAGEGTFACQLNDGADTVRARVPIGPGSKAAGAMLDHDGGDSPWCNPAVRLQRGRTYHVEFAFVDRRASLALDGREVVPALDLPGDPTALPKRESVTRPVQFGIQGASVVLRNLRLARDAHYRAFGQSGCDAPYRLGPDEYFVLGDNSANSSDSRSWENDLTRQHIPGVPERDFIGKPFLIHQPLKAGRVTVNGQDRTFQTVDWSRMRWMR
jgi:signal peptidase I